MEAEVAAALKINVSGGEQDNDLAQWRRMIRMDAVDILQRICAISAVSRAPARRKNGAKAGKLVVPHSSHLSLITVFSLHLMAAIRTLGRLSSSASRRTPTSASDSTVRP